MKTLILTICIIALFFLNVKGQISFHIYGSIDRSDNKNNYILDDRQLVDSTNVKFSSFDIHDTSKTQAIYRFIFICNYKVEQK